MLVVATAGVGTAQQSVGTGTAFLVHPDGLLLTANHVIDGATSITVSCGRGDPIRAVVDARAPQNDLAVLRTRSRPETQAFFHVRLKVP